VLPGPLGLRRSVVDRPKRHDLARASLHSRLRRRAHQPASRVGAGRLLRLCS
jgi:hypothetical protein